MLKHSLWETKISKPVHIVILPYTLPCELMHALAGKKSQCTSPCKPIRARVHAGLAHIQDTVHVRDSQQLRSEPRTPIGGRCVAVLQQTNRNGTTSHVAWCDPHLMSGQKDGFHIKPAAILTSELYLSHNLGGTINDLYR